MLLEKMAHRHCPASPELMQPKSAEPPAQHPPPAMQPAPPQAIRRPHPDHRPIEQDRVVAQGVGRKSSWQAIQATSAAPLASRIR
jgi:hypothetical protein